jgi:hypothetical protein
MAQGRPRKPKIDVGPNPTFAELEREVGTLRGSVATLQRGNRLLIQRVQVLATVLGCIVLGILALIGLVNVIKWYFGIHGYTDAVLFTILALMVTTVLVVIGHTIWRAYDD